MTFKVTAKLDPGFHIYKYTKEADRVRSTPPSTSSTPPASRSRETGFPPRTRQAQGPQFPELEFVEYYEDEVTWTIKLGFPRGRSRARRSCAARPRYHGL